MTQEVLPYGGDSNPNSGYAGSDTSRERAERDDANGATGRRQRAVLAFAARSAERGITYKDCEEIGLLHGSASGALSNLHGAGLLARLAERRSRCEIYVLPEHVNGRETKAHGRTSSRQLLDDMYDLLRGYSPCMFHLEVHADMHPDCRLCCISVLIKRYQNLGGTP